MTLRHSRVLRPLLLTLVFSMMASVLSAADLEDYGPVRLDLLASGLDRPIYVTTPPGDLGRLFIVEQTGAILIFDRDSGEVNAQPFLQISPNTFGNERGLLGLAFHPQYEDNGWFYINYTGTGGATFIDRYQVSEDPDIADSASVQTVLTFSQPFSNHNGGWMGFGPDGYLYIASGDGGSGNDPQDHGQNRNTLLGAMLRIDVDGDDFPDENDRNYAIPSNNPFVGSDGRDEIWAYGLRNPWRASFDRSTGDLWIADVGQSAREEINFQPADSPGGENYGWRLREGMIATPTPFGNPVGGPRPPDNVDPIHDYDFSDGNKAIIGGYVYRGESMPQLQGKYFYADYVADFVESLRYDGETVTDITDWTPFFSGRQGSLVNPSSFGEDAEGELYITTLDNLLYRITQPPWYLWRNRYFSAEEIADPAISGELAVPAGDGVSNRVKYALGLDPKVSGHPLPIETRPQSFEVNGSGPEPYLTMTIERNPDADDVTFIVEASDDLGVTDPWNSAGMVVVEDTPGLLVVRDGVPVNERDRRFLRLRVER